jgi:hypothetical protein
MPMVVTVVVMVVVLAVVAVSDTGNNMGDWNHFKITETITEQHTGKARN